MSFREVEPTLRAESAMDVIAVANRAVRRPRAFTAREALIALQFEANLIYVMAANLRNRVELDNDDFERLGVACGRVLAICTEAVG